MFFIYFLYSLLKFWFTIKDKFFWHIFTMFYKIIILFIIVVFTIYNTLDSLIWTALSNVQDPTGLAAFLFEQHPQIHGHFMSHGLQVIRLWSRAAGRGLVLGQWDKVRHNRTFFWPGPVANAGDLHNWDLGPYPHHGKYNQSWYKMQLKLPSQAVHASRLTQPARLPNCVRIASK